MLVAGLAEMDLAVDDAGQDVQALGLEHLRRLGVGERADGGDAAGAHADIGRGNAVRRGDGAAPDQKIERFRHAEGSRPRARALATARRGITS